MKVEIITDMTAEPVALIDVKNYLRVTGNGHDNVIANMITGARKYLEKATNLSFGQKEIKVTVVSEIEDEDLLPYGPVSNVEESSDDDYYYYEYDAGFEDLPEDLRMALLMLIKHWFDVDDIATEVPNVIKRIIQVNERNMML